MQPGCSHPRHPADSDVISHEELLTDSRLGHGSPDGSTNWSNLSPIDCPIFA